MITDKRRSTLGRTLICLLLLAVSLSALSSCARDKSGDLYDKIFSSESGESKSVAFDKYILILPSDCSSDLYSAAEQLGEKISERTSTKTELRYDRSTKSLEEGECEILIGKTARKESEEYLKSFKVKDFGYAYRDGVILIGGISDSAVLSAIDSFVLDVLVYADEEILMNHDAALFCEGEYEIKKVTLCGFELWDYSVIYPNDDAVARLGAMRLRDEVLERAGYMLEIKSELESEENERAIRIGDTSLSAEGGCTETEARLTPRSTGVSLTYGSNYGMDVAIDRLLEGLFSVDENASAALDISEEERIAISSFGASMLNLYPLKKQLSLNEAVGIVSYVGNAAPTILRVCGASEQTARYLVENLMNSYSAVKASGAESGVYYLVRNDSLTLIDSDTKTEQGVSVSRFTYVTPIDGFELCVIAVSADDKTDEAQASSAALIVAEMVKSVGDQRVVIDSPFCGNAAFAFEGELQGAHRIIDYDNSYAEIYGYLYRNGSYISVSDTEGTADSAAAYTLANVTLYK